MTIRLIGATLGGFALLATTSAHAQSGFETGVSGTGVLNAESDRYDDRPSECFVVPTRAGVNYEAELRSIEFDALLAAGEGRDCSQPAVVENDDHGDSSDSRVRFVGTGKPWFLRAWSFNANTYGEFQISFDPRSIYTPGLDIDASTAGVLDQDDLKDPSGLTFDCVPMFGMINQPVTIDLRSDAFDARLALHEGRDCLGAEIAEDDDGGGGTDARISMRLPKSGDYAIRVSMFSIDASGAYTLAIADPNRGKTGASLWSDVTPATGCGYARGSRAFTPVTFKAAPENTGGRRRLNGVVIVDGRERTREDAGLTYAEGRSWYDSNASITVNGRAYSKYGLPRFIDATELAFLTEHDGVATAIAAGDDARDVIYVHADGFECTFQPYQAAT